MLVALRKIQVRTGTSASARPVNLKARPAPGRSPSERARRTRPGYSLCREGRWEPAGCRRARRRPLRRTASLEPLPEAARARWRGESHLPPRCKIKTAASTGGGVSSDASKIQTGALVELMTQNQTNGRFRHIAVRVSKYVLATKVPRSSLPSSPTPLKFQRRHRSI